MSIPMNAAAEEIQRLRGVNGDIDEQIAELQRTQLRNAEVIGNLSHVAVWADTSEIVDEPVDNPVEGDPELNEEGATDE